jgi:anionic cell wall polymer biosynthesis LytR-Cps2A-Psr (LCP) family protein
MVRTVRDLSGIEINHVMEMTFGGFRDLVDAVGGVDLCLDEPINDRDAGIDLPAAVSAWMERTRSGSSASARSTTT